MCQCSLSLDLRPSSAEHSPFFLWWDRVGDRGIHCGFVAVVMAVAYRGPGEAARPNRMSDITRQTSEGVWRGGQGA